MEPQRPSASLEDDLLAALEPPTVDQYWLSEEELRAISADPDLTAAFGNPYIPPNGLDPNLLRLSGTDVPMPAAPGLRRAVDVSYIRSEFAPVLSTPSPQSPQSPASASSPAGSGEDDGSSEEPRPAAASTGAKKRRTAEEKDIDLLFLSITKDQLQVISSKQLDGRVAQVQASGRKFNADERKAITAARRRIKNREYARDMRDKAARQMTDMSSRVTELETENHSLKSQVAALQHENAMLKSQLGISTNVYQPPTAPRSVLGKRGTPQIAAGACLLVLLFSFGFYFNFTSPTPFDTTMQGRSGVSTGRVLLHEAETSTRWSFVSALQRAVFAFRYGSESSCRCDSHQHAKDVVCVDKDEFRLLGRRCDLSGLTTHEE